ncbi:uncharacterized protein LOC143288870 [Babylonia areolata]|uniref:uncharacterized protein LOC143288870 n=1 Tax=Babylonia areolata TaxID=304850 RepID=UPI003FD2DB97
MAASTGAEPVSDDRNIFIAISSGKVNRLHSILSTIEDLNVRDTHLRTPLIHAVFIANDDVRTHVVRLLLRHGCDVNAQDSAGRTALMYGCMERDKMDVVRLLAKCRRCDPNLQDNDGNTALVHCVEGGNASAIRILTRHASMKSRLKVNLVNGAGLSALELAVKLGLADCCRILVKDGGADSTKIKNRQLLMELLNEDRTRTPFDVSPSPNLEDADLPLSSPRDLPLSPRGPLDCGGGGSGGVLSHRSDMELYTRRSPSRQDQPGPGTPRPGSDFPRRLNRSVISLRKDISCEVPLNTARPLSRDFTNNPFLEMVRQDSSLYVPNSRTTFRRAIITSKDSGGRKNSLDKAKAAAMRRPLTPILCKTADDSRAVTPVGVIPQQARLPSIPSGKRVYGNNSSMLTPCDTPTEY